MASEEEWKERLGVARDSVRAKRRDALRWIAERLEREARESPVEPSAALARFDLVRGPLLAALADDNEQCREFALRGTAALVSALPSEYALAHVVPALHERLAGAETAEASEELRLRGVELLRDAAVRFENDPRLRPHYDQYADIIIKTVADDYPEAKKAACQAAVALARALPQDFHMRAEALIKATLPNFSHRHYKVRAAAVECIGASVLHGNDACFQSAIESMAKMLLDDNATVRLQVTKDVSSWMLNLRDRYSYFHYMIPLILTSLSDDMEEVSSEAKVFWEKIGSQYMEENEEEFKAQLDYLSSSPSHYPPSVPRPNFGCRILVIRNMGKILPAILRELEGWNSDVKQRSAQILSSIVLHAEAKNVQYTSDIVSCLMKGAKDTSETVTFEIRRSCEYLGYFIGPNIWWNFVTVDIEMWSALVVLANIIKGSNVEILREKYLRKIMKELASSRVRTTPDAKFQIHLLNTCESLMHVCEIHCQTISQEMFDILFTIFAMPSNEDVRQRASDLLGKFRETIQFGSTVEDMYCVFIRSLLVGITTEPCYWTPRTPDRLILNAVLLHTGAAIGRHLHIISPILTEVLAFAESGGDYPEIKLEIFTSLSEMLLQRDERFRLTEPFKLEAFMKVMLYDIIIPNMSWSAGKTSECLRTIAVCCLCGVLQENEPKENVKKLDFKPIDLFPNVEILQKNIDDLLPIIITLLSDNSKNTRQYALRAICSLVELAKKKSCFKAEHLHKTYTEVISHLDDSNDDIRRYAVETLCVLFMARPEPYDIDTFCTHIDALYSAMLLHLDDPDTVFTENILDALKKICVVHPKLLKGKVDASTKLYRNQKALEHLDKHLESLSI